MIKVIDIDLETLADSDQQLLLAAILYFLITVFYYKKPGVPQGVDGFN